MFFLSLPFGFPHIPLIRSTIKNVQWYQSAEYERSRENQKSLKSFCLIFIKLTINRQVIDLALTLAFYNLNQDLEKPKEKPLVITVGGLIYTSNAEAFNRTYLLEKKYWKIFLACH